MKSQDVLYKYSYMGAFFAGIILVFTFGGRYADSLLETTPWGMVAGLLIGFPLALYRILLLAKEMEEEMRIAEKNEKAEEGAKEHSQDIKQTQKP